MNKIEAKQILTNVINSIQLKKADYDVLNDAIETLSKVEETKKKNG